MGQKLWFFAALFTFILAGFSANLLFHDKYRVTQSPLLRVPGDSHEKDNANVYFSTLQWITSRITHEVFGGWSLGGGGNITTGQVKTSNNIPLAPDLATCHKSLSDGGQPLYCCPPRKESKEQAIDFQFPSASHPVRIRRPAHLVDDEYIAKYEKAIAIMKQLPYDDPLSFMRQADLHCIYCTGAYNQVNSTVGMSIHRSWFFFPWHRMYVYFHERIIGKLIGDDTFALPYWNWDAPLGMMIPSFYMNGSLFDKDRDHSHFPPAITKYDYDNHQSKDQIATNLAFMYNQMVSSAKKPELFMGCTRGWGEEGACDGPGTIENSPHNTVHAWVGSNLKTERENMGAFYSAARDPIFFAHHANIDRLWVIWKQLRGNHLEFTDPVWLDSHFYFHNENRQLVRIKIRDVLNITKLRVIYEEADIPWLNARPKPSVSPKIAHQMLRMRDKRKDLPSSSLSPSFGPEGKTLATTIRVKVQRPKRDKTKKGREGEGEEEEEVLVVHGIDVKKDMYVKFDVYVNVADETTIGPESREFAGTFVNLPHGVRIIKNKGDSTLQMKSSLKLGISELLEDLDLGKEESIWVTVVPKGGTGINTTIEGIRIEYLR